MANYNDMFEKWSKISQKSLEQMFDFSSLGAQRYTEFTREYIQIVHDFYKAQTEHVKNVSQAKGFEDIIKEQRNFVAKVSPLYFNYAQFGLETALDSLTEARQSFENLVNNFSNVKK